MQAKHTISRSVVVFPSKLGWMAMVLNGREVERLSFGHDSSAAAVRAVAPESIVDLDQLPRWQASLVERLQRFTAGEQDDFQDVDVSMCGCTEFQASILKACRKISYGSTVTYGDLAARCGVPGGGRAVGNCMARNRVPLIIPCHRVVRAGGQIGPFSAPGGTATKRRLLEMEAAATALVPLH